MTARVVDLDVLAEDERVYYWRLCRLLDLGYVMQEADELASGEADLHALETLVLRRGCPLDLAAAILR